MKLKLFLLTILSVAGLMLPGLSFASVSPLTVNLGQPKSPTRLDNLKLTFVVLQIGGTENIAVSCYKKSPSDSAYVKFQDISLIPGGNTDFCNVTSSILNTPGTYKFKVQANGVKDSNEITVDYNNNAPSTPGSYSKERLNDCDYKIKFKTADDGRTSKVELFRSDTTSISIDSGHLVGTQNIGPNTEGSITNSIPVCGKEYFYAIRAVDNSENVSGITGDNQTKYITESTTTTATATTGTTPAGTTQGALVTGDGSQVTAEGTTTPGAEATITPAEGTGTDSTQPGTPEVLGTQTSKWTNLKWLSIPLVLVAFYFFRKSRKRA